MKNHERTKLRYRKPTLDLLKDPPGPLAGPFCTGEIAVMNELLIAYARVSTYEQDLTAQRNAQLAELFNVGRATVYRTVRRQEGLIGPKYGH